MRIRRWQPVMVWLVLTVSAMSQSHPMRISDSSDWWSWIRQEEEPLHEPIKFQGREPAEANFQIAGVTLGAAHDFRPIRSEFGEAAEVERGDAASGRDQICYVSPSGSPHLIFEFGEVASVVYLFEGGPKWNGSELCAMNPRVSAGISTASGLRLGLGPQQVKTILGTPNVATPDKLVYYFEFKKKTSAEELAQLRKDNLSMTDAEFRRNFEFLGVTAYFEARFAAGKLNYLAISRSEVY